MKILNQKKYLWIYLIWVTLFRLFMNILNNRKNHYWIYWIWVKCIVRATYMYEYIESEWQDYLAESSLSLSMLGSRPFLRRSPPWLPALEENLWGNLSEFINKCWSLILFPVDNLTVCYLSLYRSLGPKPIPINPRHPFKRHTHCSQTLFTLSNKKIFEIPQFLLKLCTSGSMVNVLTSRNQARTCFKTSANLSLSIS